MAGDLLTPDFAKERSDLGEWVGMPRIFTAKAKFHSFFDTDAAFFYIPNPYSRLFLDLPGKRVGH